MIDRVLEWAVDTIEGWIYRRERRQELRDRKAGYPDEGPITRAYREGFEEDFIRRFEDLPGSTLE